MNRRQLLKLALKAGACELLPRCLKKRCERMAKTIIEFGANQHPPGTYTDWLASNYSDMQGSIVDGSCFIPQDNDGTNQQNYIYSSTAFEIDDFSNMIAAFNAQARRGWGRSFKNLLYWHFNQSVIDWISGNLTPVISNFELMGRLAKECGFHGVLLDFEPYGSNVWSYQNQAHKNNYSLEQYRTAAYNVAREIASRWKITDPDFRLYIFKSYSWFVREFNSDGEGTSNYDIAPNFLDGIFDVFGENQRTMKVGPGFAHVASRPSKSRVIMCDPEWWNTYNQTDRQTAIDNLKGLTGRTGGTNYFDEVADFGKLLWIDLPGLDGGPYPLFDNDDPSNSFYDQDQFVDYVEFALGQLDTLIIFNQYYNFWSNSDFGYGVLNTLYIDALRQYRLNSGLR